MSEFDLIPGERPAITSAFYILITTLLGFFIIGPMIGAVLAIPFMEGGFSELIANMNDPQAHPEIKNVLFIMQGSATIFGLILGPSIYWYAFEKKRVVDLVVNRPVPPIAFLVTILTVICFMVPNTIFINWNSNIVFPDFLNRFESWARDTEEDARRLTDFLTTFNSFGEFAVAIFVIAVLAGIGEELVFRGMLQPKLQKATGNVHVAIWISAFIFSFIHLQFFGFFPRMFLGVLFGYLYAWSGNLLVPITAHFANNAFGVLMIYLHQKGIVNLDVDSTEALPWAAVISGTILTFGLVFILKRLFKRNTASS